MNEMTPNSVFILLTQICGLTFLAITFLQAGLDKVFDYKGNLEYLTAHFSKSILAPTIGLLTPTLTLVEVLSGLLCVAGILGLLLWGSSLVAQIAPIACLITLLMLFFGQRMAKDYAGAAGLTGYFIIALATSVLLNWNH
jgi:hypothetical protein